MLLAISICFTLLIIPQFLIEILQRLQVAIPHWLDLISEILLDCNYSVNFIFYVCLGKQFREELVLMLSKCFPQLRGTQVAPINIAHVPPAQGHSLTHFVTDMNHQAAPARDGGNGGDNAGEGTSAV